MALIKATLIKKCGQYVTESFKIRSRFVALSNLSLTNPVTESNQTQNQSETTGPPPSEIETKLRADLNVINKEVSVLKAKTVELTDKYKRSLADGENLRQRMSKQIQDAKIFGIQNFCKDLLEVADVLNRATESVPKEELNERNPHLKSLYEGLCMTESQLRAVFKRHGVETLNPVDEKFNPNMHEALFQQEVAGKKAGTIISVSKIGYKLNERVIRPALVGVAK